MGGASKENATMFARTERLVLRPCWPEDAEAIYNAINDEGIVRNLARAPWPYSHWDAQEFAALQHDLQHPNFLLFKRTTAEPKLIGSCGLGDLDGETEIGYWIARPYWGLGYASEAARAVVSIARAIGHKRLSCGHFVDNPASGQVMRKLGFRPTGRIEQRFSRGRGQSVACVTMELSLEDANDSDAGSDVDPMLLPYDAQLKAA
jgi:RimJ/RimL family protein N-acetyltransferase